MVLRIFQPNKYHACKSVILSLLAVICAISVMESGASAGTVFHGLDFYTISGLQSTSEVFTTGGTYQLHDYSVLTPGCEGCDPLTPEASFGPPTEVQGPDGFTRFVDTPRIHIANVGARQHVKAVPESEVAGQAVSPELPPPKLHV